MQFLSTGKDAFDTSVADMIGQGLPVYGVRGKGPGFEFAKLYPEDQLPLDYDICTFPESARASHLRKSEAERQTG